MNIYEFISNHLFLSFGLLLSFLLLIFNELKTKQQNLANIDPFKAVNLINSGASVIDLRSSDAFKTGHIVNSKSMTVDQLNTSHEKLKKSKQRAMVIVCSDGSISSKAGNKLRSDGKENVFGISGGLTGWSEANMPLVTKQKK